MHKAAHDTNDNHHYCGEVIDGHSEIDMQRANTRHIAEAHPFEIPIYRFGIRRQLLEENDERKCEAGEQNRRSQPVALTRELLPEEDQEYESGQRQQQDNLR